MAAMIGLIAFFLAGAAAAAGPPSTATAPATAGLSLEQRLECLAELFGPAVHLGPISVGSARIPVSAAFSFDSPDELQSFAVVQNDWAVRDGALHGSGLGVSRIVSLLPLLSASCQVRGRLRSSHTFELSMLDPLADRSAGTRAVARLHFGRMEHYATTDWMELSSKERSLDRLYECRFPARMQEASLQLADRELKSKLSVDQGWKTMRGRVLPADLSPVVCVSMAGMVNNRVEIDEVHLTGSIDLDSDQVTVLTGLGQAFWGDGREVTVYYRARGHCRRLLLNGKAVAEQEATPGIWWPTDGPLHRTVLRLAHGDVLVFKLAGVDDEGALHAVGVDQATGRVVFATHPLTFAIAWGIPDEDWRRSFERNWDNRPHISVAQDEQTVRRFRAALGRDFPGLPIVGPYIDNDIMYFKTQIR